MTMKRWKQGLLLSAIFCSGMVVGAAGAVGVAGYFIKTKAHLVLKGDQTKFVDYMTDRLTDKLEMDQSQRAAIRPVLVNAVADFRTLHKNFRLRFHQVFAKTQSEVKVHLNQEQQEKFDKLIRNLKRKIPPLSEP